MQELILTTDVAEHLKVIKEIEQMVEGLFTHALLYVLKFDRIGYIDSAIWTAWLNCFDIWYLTWFKDVLHIRSS